MSNLLSLDDYNDLAYATDHDIIDIKDISAKVNMVKRKEILEKKHPYKIWQSKDGKWYTHLPDENKQEKRKLCKRTSQKAIEDVIVEYWKQEMENPTIADVFKEWNDRRLDLEVIERATHDRNIRIFNRHYEEFGKRRIKNVSPEEFADFLEEQVPIHHLNAKAFQNLKTVTRGMLKRAKKRKLISYNPNEMLEDLEISRKSYNHSVKDDQEQVFSQAEEIQMVNFLLNNLDIWNLGILLLFVTGLRVGELVTLKWDCVTKETLIICRTETKYEDHQGHNIYEVKEHPKTEAGIREVVIPVNYRWIIDEIRKINLDGEYLFMRKGKRMTGNTINKRLERNCEKLGMPRRSTHDIRKTYASKLLDNKVDQRLILSQMGHTDIKTTETYYHKDRRNITEKADILTPIVTMGIEPPQVCYAS